MRILNNKGNIMGEYCLEITSPPIGEDTSNKVWKGHYIRCLEITSPPIGEDTGFIRPFPRCIMSLEITSPPIGEDTPRNSVFERRTF